MRFSALAGAAVGALLGLGCAFPSVAQERHRAAGIDYAFVERPAWLPAAVAAPDGVELRFLAIEAIDGYRVDAALWQPKGASPGSTPLVVSAHGSGGNFHSSGVSGFLSPGLAARGYAVLSISTRQHDGFVYTDNFFDVRKDIDAAMWTARALGYRAIALHGFSLGSIQMQYYAASDWSPDIKAAVLTGPFANLAWKTRYVVDRDETNYRALYEAARDQLRAGRAPEKMPVEMNWHGHRSVPMSGQHFLTYRWEGTGVADGTFWIARVPRPILIVHDEGDAVVAGYEPAQLAAAARAEGTIVPSVKLVSLPNPKGPNPAGHSFQDNRGLLIETVAAWLEEQGLKPARTAPVASGTGAATPAAASTAAEAGKYFSRRR